MATVCSAVCCWSKAGDNTVGISINCSTTHGLRRTVREGHDDEETLGTSITCSAIGKSMRRKESVTLSTICGTVRSRICTNWQTIPMSSTKCRCTRSCQPATSDRGAGRPLGERRFRNVAVQCISCLSSPGPCHLRALCAVVQRLGKGHCDRHPLVAQVRAEASLSPAAGTPCDATGANTKTLVTRTEVSNLGQGGTWWWW